MFWEYSNFKASITFATIDSTSVWDKLGCIGKESKSLDCSQRLENLHFWQMNNQESIHVYE